MSAVESIADQTNLILPSRAPHIDSEPPFYDPYSPESDPLSFNESTSTYPPVLSAESNSILHSSTSLPEVHVESMTVLSPPRIGTPLSRGLNSYTTYEPRASEGILASKNFHDHSQQDPDPLESSAPLPRQPTASPASRPYSPLPFNSLKVLFWTPQMGDEGAAVTIILDSLALHPSPSPNSSSSLLPYFGTGFGEDYKRDTHEIVTRKFVVSFGKCAVPTVFSRTRIIPETGARSVGEEDAFVVLSTFVPNRENMVDETGLVFVTVSVVDETGRVVDEVGVGQWTSQELLSSAAQHRKRAGDELHNPRPAPGTTVASPPGHHSQMLSPTEAAEWLSPPLSHRQISPQPTHPSPPHEERITPSTLRHPPLLDPNASAPQPELIRTSQIPSTPAVNPFGGGTFATYSNKAILKLQGDLNQMAMGWSNEEWTNRRRLIQFWRQQEGNVINATFRPIGQQDFVPNSIVISCVFRDDWNECFVTSVDAIYLLEALVGVRFSVEEKNRIRRNLEGFKPMTVSKSKVESEPFFKLIMGFPNPKPRNIEKDVKVFPWKILSSALKKIISKYSATYTAPVDGSVAQPNEISEGSYEAPSPRQMAPLPERFHQPPPPNHTTHSPAPGTNSHGGLALSPYSAGIPRPGSGSFDYNSILDTSNFAGASGHHHLASNAHSFHDPGSHLDSHSHYALQPASLFPSAEDYGGALASDRMIPPGHARSYSDGPRRNSLNGSSGYANNYIGSNGGGNIYDYYPPQSDWDQHNSGHNGDRRNSRDWKALGAPTYARSTSMEGLTASRDMMYHTAGASYQTER